MNRETIREWEKFPYTAVSPHGMGIILDIFTGNDILTAVRFHMLDLLVLRCILWVDESERAK